MEITCSGGLISDFCLNLGNVEVLRRVVVTEFLYFNLLGLIEQVRFGVFVLHFVMFGSLRF